MLEQSIMKTRNFAQQRKYKNFRSNFNANFLKQFADQHFSFAKRSAHILKEMCEAESPFVETDEHISFVRTKSNVPYYYDHDFIKKMYRPGKGTHYDVFHNVCPDYSILLNVGLGKVLFDAKNKLKTATNQTKRDFLESVVISIQAVLDLARRYSEVAKRKGNTVVSEAYLNVPEKPAATFLEALQSLRFVSSMFYLADNYQFGFGRLDQYLYPFYCKDLEEKKLSQQDAKKLLAEFFVSLNKDTDLYRGIQQGDNGQSLMLGGCKTDGSPAVNELTYMIMEVSRDLRLIDPKINLRIDSNTPGDLLELGCELTKVGLGFPQYSNDEVVIPALVKKGYDIEDARNYTVAACWEFIIPGKGLDIVNQGAVSFPAAVDFALEKTLKLNSKKFDFGVFRAHISACIESQIKRILKFRNLKILPSPFASIFFSDLSDFTQDASITAKYKNVGIHGSGSSNAADALAAIKLTYESDGIEGLKVLVEAKKNNFSEYEPLRKKLHDEMPKVGNDDPAVDEELRFLFDSFANCAEKLSTKNRKIRPGSGSAMYYIWLTDINTSATLLEPVVGATVDGRMAGEAFSTSLAPSHSIKVNGVASVLKSFSNIDYSRIMNGGPITIELTPSVFEAKDGIKKLAALIKYFVKLGDQQLQLNVLDIATLEDAIKNPAAHKNLIVRVWGWSGYFCELAPEYQHHIINRHKYGI